MWGNLPGWIASGVLATCTLLLHVLVILPAGEMSGPTPAFKADPQNLEELRFPSDPEEVYRPAGNADAGDLYRQAMDDYRASKDAYVAFAKRGTKAEDAAKLKGVGLVLDGGKCARMNLFSRKPSELVTYSSDRRPLAALLGVARAVERAGLLEHAAGRDAQAVRHFKSIFALGTKLYNERITYDELQIGLQCLSMGASGLARYAGEVEPALAARAKAFPESYGKYVEQYVTPLHQITRTVDPNISGQRAGDVFYLVRNSKERMWRVEAVLQLGRYRYNIGTGRGQDQRGAIRMLAELADREPDLVVKHAASMARDLDERTYNLQTTVYED